MIEGFHHRHALVHAALIRMAVCLVGKCGVGVPQYAGQGDDIRVILHPVGGEGMVQGMDAARRKASFIQYPAKCTVEVMPIRWIPDSVCKDVGAASA